MDETLQSQLRNPAVKRTTSSTKKKILRVTKRENPREMREKKTTPTRGAKEKGSILESPIKTARLQRNQRDKGKTNPHHQKK